MRNRGLGGVERGADLLKPARVESHPYPRRRQGRVGRDELGGQGIQPHAHRLELPGVERPTPVRRHQPAAERSVARGDRVADRLGRIAVVLIPLRRPLVQRGGLLRCRARKLMAQQPGEEVVVPEGVSAGVDRDDEQILGCESPKQPMTVGSVGDGVAQWRVELAEDGRLEEEVLNVRRLALQDLAEQVVGHGRVRAREAADERFGVFLAPEGKRRQLQAGDPPLGSLS